jgi:hypothetical protein
MLTFVVSVLLLSPFLQRRDDLILLLRLELGIHRERQHLVGRALGVREIADLVPQFGEAALQMNRDRVVNVGAHPALG